MGDWKAASPREPMGPSSFYDLKTDIGESKTYRGKCAVVQKMHNLFRRRVWIRRIGRSQSESPPPPASKIFVGFPLCPSQNTQVVCRFVLLAWNEDLPMPSKVRCVRLPIPPTAEAARWGYACH